MSRCFADFSFVGNNVANSPAVLTVLGLRPLARFIVSFFSYLIVILHKTIGNDHGLLNDPVPYILPRSIDFSPSLSSSWSPHQ